MGKKIIIGVLIAIGGLVLVCIVLAAVGGLAVFNLTSGPREAVDRYYNAVRAENWQAAHGELAPSFSQRVSPQDLQQAFEQEEDANGPITGVNITNTNINNNQATVEATINRERQTGTVNVQLVKEGEAWKITGFGS